MTRGAFTFYFDLRCPFCFVASERLMAVSDRPPIEYRSVRHDRDLPVPAREQTSSERDFVEKELVVLRERAPEANLANPELWPSTAPVARAVAAMARTSRGDAAVFVSAMYRAFWREGRDPSSAMVLGGALRDAGAGGLVVSAEDDALLATWGRDWAGMEQRTPTFVSATGVALVGLASARRLEAFLRSGRLGEASEDAC